MTTAYAKRDFGEDEFEMELPNEENQEHQFSNEGVSAHNDYAPAYSHAEETTAAYEHNQHNEHYQASDQTVETGSEMEASARKGRGRPGRRSVASEQPVRAEMKPVKGVRLSIELSPETYKIFDVAVFLGYADCALDIVAEAIQEKANELMEELKSRKKPAVKSKN
jgi:DNA primase large subunit